MLTNITMVKLKKHIRKISSPIKVKHLGKDLKWSFDSSVEPKTIFSNLETIGKGGLDLVQS